MKPPDPEDLTEEDLARRRRHNGNSWAPPYAPSCSSRSAAS